MTKRSRILIYSSLIWHIGEGIFYPLAPIFILSIGGTAASISISWTLFLITCGLIETVVGKLTKYISDEDCIMIAHVINTIVSFSFLLATSVYHVYIINCFLGIAAGLVAPPWRTIFSKGISGNQTGSWGISSGFEKICLAGGALIGAVLITLFNFSVIFILMGIIQTVSGIVQFTIYNLQFDKN